MADEKKEPQVENATAAQAEAPAPEQAAADKPARAPKAAKSEEAPKAEKGPRMPKGYTPRLKADYDERIVPAMTERFGYKNRMEVPRLDKIVINMGVGEATKDKKKVETAAAEMQ